MRWRRPDFGAIAGRLSEPRFALSTLLGVVFGMGMVRALIEVRLFGESLVGQASLGHLALFFVCAFVAGGFVIASMSGTTLRSALNAMLVLWPVTLVTPFVDAFVLGRTTPYAYERVETLGSDATHLFATSQGAGAALLLQLLAFSVLGGVYVYLMRRSVLRAGVAALLLMAVATVSAAPGLIVPWLDPARLLGVFGSTGAGDAAFVLYYATIVATLLVLATARDHALTVKDLLRIVRPGPAAVYGGVLVLGYAYGLRQSGAEAASIVAVVHGLLLLGGWLACWQAIVMTNDIYDVDIDLVSHPARPLPAGTLTTDAYAEAITVLVMGSLLLVGVVSWKAALLVPGALGVLGAVYSVPPLAVKRRLLGAPVVMALSAGVLALAGLLVAGGCVDARAALLGGVMIASFLLGVVTKDRRDAEGDANAGARTLFTLLPERSATVVVSALCFVSAVLPLVAFPGLLHAVIFVGIAVSVALVFWRTGSMRWVFPVYLVELAYVGWSLFG